MEEKKWKSFYTGSILLPFDDNFYNSMKLILSLFIMAIIAQECDVADGFLILPQNFLYLIFFI